MKNKLFGAIALLALVAAPALAEAATRGFATANVNMRSGPSTAYPAVVVIPNGAPLTIHGCLSDTPWCDVSFSYGRGWVAGRYVQAMYRQNRVYVEPRYYRDLGVPIVTFEVGRYWDQNYRDRDFYRERDRWRRPPPSGGYWNAPPPWADRDRPRPREEWRDPRGRGPNDGRWERQYGNWDQNDRDRRDGDRDRADRDRRDGDRERWERDRDRNRDQDRAWREQRSNDDRRQWDVDRRDGDRNRDGERAPRPPRDGQQFGCIVGSPGCPNP